MNRMIDRKTGEAVDLYVMKGQAFLYRTFFGRLVLKIATRPFISKIGGMYLNSKLSKKRIPSFVKKNNIDTSIFYTDDINSFNDFFKRKIKESSRPIDMEKSHLIAPCDSKLTVYDINEDSIYQIKDSYYKVSDLLKNEDLAKEFVGGKCLVFRLTVDDYHRYLYIDDGKKGENIHIKGVLHTVNPIALERYNFYKTNSREYTVMETENFGKVVQIEVGALMVGKISNLHEEYTFSRGEEKGNFEFGGSTIVLLVKDVVIDSDILENSKNGDETSVKYGEKIGVKA